MRRSLGIVFGLSVATVMGLSSCSYRSMLDRLAPKKEVEFAAKVWNTTRRRHGLVEPNTVSSGSSLNLQGSGFAIFGRIRRGGIPARPRPLAKD